VAPGLQALAGAAIDDGQIGQGAGLGGAGKGRQQGGNAG
jgi:hypothetical protein